MGVVTNVMAVEESYCDSDSVKYEIEDDGTAEFLINCSYEFIDDESSKETNGSAFYAYADVVLFGDNAPYFDFSASSWHTGTINDKSVNDYLTAGY